MRPIWTRIFNLGLWPRMALAISLGFLFLFLAMSLLGERALRDSSAHLFEERLVMAQIAAGQVDQLLLRSAHELEEIPHFSGFNVTDPDLSHEAEILAYVSRETSLFAPGIVIRDATGRVLLSHPPGIYAYRSEVPELPFAILEDDSAIFSKPYRDTISNRPVTAVTVPIYEEDRFVGLVSGLLDLEEQAVTRLLQQTSMVGDTTHSTLVDSQGRVLASTLDLPFLTLGEHPTFYRQAMARGEATVDTVPLETENVSDASSVDFHVQALAPLSEVPWGLAVGGEEEEILAGVGRLRLDLVLLGSVALVALWVTTLIGTRRLIRPVQHLTAAAQQIADGEMRTPLHVSETGEIGAMATALEHMRQQLLANIEELANWNETLESRVAKQTEELRRQHEELRRQQDLTQQLLRRTLTVQEEERARISRELHDHIGQILTAVGLSLDRLSNSLGIGDVKARERLQRSRALTDQSVSDLRRVIAALRPGILDKLGLAPALKWMSDNALRPLGLTVTIESDLQRRLPGEIETTLFRIAQETMNNVARHSQASHLTIQLQGQNGRVMMSLIDDGKGFDPSAVSLAPDYSQGLGLVSMQERASLVGGRVTVESEPGRGATVSVAIPLSPVAVRSVPSE